MNNRQKLIYSVLIAGLLMGFLGGCSSDRPKYIFLITLDTTRMDFINTTRTPNLSSLAAEGVSYSNAYSLIPITLPSHAAMLCSQPPHKLKVYNNGQPGAYHGRSVVPLLKQHGFTTAAVISLGVLKSDFGLNTGFDKYDETFRPGLWYRTAEEVNRAVFQAVGNKKKGKHFYWIHYSDPHDPYYPPYYHSDFYAYFNDVPVYEMKKGDQCLVKLSLNLKPGENRLRMSPRMSAELLDKENSTVKTVVYKNLQIQPIPEVTVAIPKHLRRKKDNSGRDYLFSRVEDIEIPIFNHSREDIRLRFSCVVQLFDTDAAFVRKMYGKSVAYMDEHVGKLLGFLKEKQMYRDSLFIVMGDHGEGLGEHKNFFGHIHFLNKLYSRVPLIIAGKGIEEMGIRNELVSNLDVAPTILAGAGIAKPEYMEGHSLLKTGPARKLLLETYTPEAFHDAFSLINYPYQLILIKQGKTRKFEMYNLEKDRLGTRDIFHRAVDIPTKTKMVRSLRKIADVISSGKGKPGKISRKHEEMLKTLGYL